MYSYFEEIGDTSVMTVAEAYAYAADVAASSGCRLEFVRVPITDERHPEPPSLDLIASAVLGGAESEGKPAFVFNCQLGRGRTTTGMALCSMLLATHDFEANDETGGRQGSRLFHTDRITWVDDAPMSIIDKAVSPLVGLLQNGANAKYLLDTCICDCATLQNLKTAIQARAERATVQADAAKKLLRDLHREQVAQLKLFSPSNQ